MRGEAKIEVKHMIAYVENIIDTCSGMIESGDTQRDILRASGHLGYAKEFRMRMQSLDPDENFLESSALNFFLSMTSKAAFEALISEILKFAEREGRAVEMWKKQGALQFAAGLSRFVEQCSRTDRKVDPEAMY